MNVYYTTKRPGYVMQEFKEEDLVKYDKEYVKKYSKYDQLFNEALNFNRLQTLLQYASPDSLLDVGYGDGTFLEKCKKNITNLYGYDVSDVDPPEGVFRVSEESLQWKYDVVTFFDSLEHVPEHDIVPYLRKFDTNCFMISVPWFHSACAYPEWFMNWKHRRENEHLHFFDSFGLISILNEIGYKVAHVSNIEDSIRPSEDDKPNILTVIAIRND